MAILSATKTAKVTLQKRRNLFGLGVTSLIAACSTDGADNDAAAGYVKPPAGPIGTIPTADKLASLGSPTANNAGITATVETSAMGDPDGRPDGFKNLGIAINLTTNPVLGDGNTVTFAIKNGNHATNAASASLYTVADTGKYDLVVSSPDFGNVAGDVLTGGVYIYWDMASNVAGTIAITNHLEVKGLPGDGAIAQAAPEFFQIGGSASAQYDMIVKSHYVDGDNPAENTGAIYILWDVAAYAGANKDAAPKTVDFANPTSATHGLLAIKGASAGDNIGANFIEIFKINNNDDYDMTIRTTGNSGSADDMYILWDVAKYYSTTAPAEISLTNLSATNGLLTIFGRGALNIGSENGGFLDIDDNGINDIVLFGGGITFVLLGEQLAYRDDKGKTVSDTVNLTNINAAFAAVANTDAGFFTYDKVVTPTTKAGLADVIGYRFDSTLENLNEVKTQYEAAVNALNLPDAALSDTDAGAGVWDIA